MVDDGKEISETLEKSNDNDPYMNSDIILGPVDEAERILSFKKYVTPDHRKSLPLQLFEAIILLKSNERLWDVGLVRKLKGCAKIRKKNSLLHEKYTLTKEYDCS